MNVWVVDFGLSGYKNEYRIAIVKKENMSFAKMYFIDWSLASGNINVTEHECNVTILQGVTD